LARRVDRFDMTKESAIPLKGERDVPTGTQIDLDAGVAKPRVEVVRFGQDRPNSFDRSGNHNFAFNLI
jgi:hypothetical protein